jgi:folate-binding protein YgfZ
MTEPSVYTDFPFDIVTMSGRESVDFLHRMTTNDFSSFREGDVQNTLAITEKGRMIDTLWVEHRGASLRLFASKGMGDAIARWLSTYIIMEEIEVTTAVPGHRVDVYFSPNGRADYFGHPCSFEMDGPLQEGYAIFSSDEFERFRIMNGIPWTAKEITSDRNPLELGLWDWISFTKGCYIGQEVIARLDTYQKVQRALFLLSSQTDIQALSPVHSADGTVLGSVTSVVRDGTGTWYGLAVLKRSTSDGQSTVLIGTERSHGRMERMFSRENHGIHRDQR